MLFNIFGIVDGYFLNVYFVVLCYLLLVCLILFIISIDLKVIFNFGLKVLIMFLMGIMGIVIGGLFVILVMSVVYLEVVGGYGFDVVWCGMIIIVGSWIGGGVN